MRKKPIYINLVLFAAPLRLVFLSTALICKTVKVEHILCGSKKQKTRKSYYEIYDIIIFSLPSNIICINS